MAELQKQMDRTSDVDLAMLERMLLVGGPGLRPALVAQLLADLDRLRQLLRAEQAAQHLGAAHELKGIAATIGAHGLARTAASLHTSLEQGASRPPADQAPQLWHELDELAGLLQARIGPLPPA